MTKYLIGRFADFPETELCFVFRYLTDFYSNPNRNRLLSEDKKLALINALDPYIGQDVKSSRIFLAAANLFYVVAIKDLEIMVAEQV